MRSKGGRAWVKTVLRWACIGYLICFLPNLLFVSALVTDEMAQGPDEFCVGLSEGAPVPDWTIDLRPLDEDCGLRVVTTLWFVLVVPVLWTLIILPPLAPIWLLARMVLRYTKRSRAAPEGEGAPAVTKAGREIENR